MWLESRWLIRAHFFRPLYRSLLFIRYRFGLKKIKINFQAIHFRVSIAFMQVIYCLRSTRPLTAHTHTRASVHTRPDRSSIIGLIYVNAYKSEFIFFSFVLTSLNCSLVAEKQQHEIQKKSERTKPNILEETRPREKKGKTEEKKKNAFALLLSWRRPQWRPWRRLQQPLSHTHEKAVLWDFRCQAKTD